MAESDQCPQCGCEIPPDSPAGICPDCLLKQGFGGPISDAGLSPVPAGNEPLSPIAAGAGSGTSGRGFEPPSVDALAPLFPGLEILELLGHGGMGAVYKARQTKLDRLVALKVIRPETAGDPAFAERFMREARTLARLSHPSIVAVHDFGEITASRNETSSESPGRDEGQETMSPALYYFVMEFVDGLNLRQLLESRELSPENAVRIVPQICEALQYAHDEGVVHRDIKPENILLDSRGRVKIADFGLAKLAGKSAQDFTLTATHQVMGTPRYMAPEQMTGSHSVDHRADIYSLGVVFYELLTGELPLGQFDPPSHKSDLDPRLDEVVLRALAQEPDRRFQQASELKSHVEYLGLSPADGTVGEPLPIGRPDRPAVSAIVEREAAAAWHWVAGRSDHRAAGRPEPPALLLFVLAVAGCLTIFLPWMKAEPQTKKTGVDESRRETAIVVSPSPTLGYWQDASGASSEFSLSSPFGNEKRIVTGLECVSGVLASVLFGVMAVLVMVSPPAGRSTVLWAVVMTLLAIGALIAVLTFPAEARGEYFNDPAFFFGSRWIEQGYSTADIESALTYQPGFFGAIGLSVVLLVLNATGVRHAVAWREPGQSEQPGTGSPVARLRFLTDASREIDRHVVSHFESHGYRLKQEKPDAWTFQRGSRYAGIFESDIRAFDTTLTVRATMTPSDQKWITCLWEVRTFGAIFTKRDVRQLESEGQELEQMLASESSATGPAEISQDPAAQAATVTGSSGQDSGSLDFVSGPGSVVQVRASSESDPDLQERMLELRLKGPVGGLRIAAAVSVLFWVCFGGFWIIDGYGPYLRGDLPYHPSLAEDFLAIGFGYVCLAVVCGVMLHGAHHMKRRTGFPWAVAAAGIAILPWHFAFLITTPLGIWALYVLLRPDVRDAFLRKELERQERTELIRQQQSRTADGINLDEVRAEIDGPAIGLIAGGFLLAAGHIITLVSFATAGYAEPPVLLFGVVVGVMMLFAGLRMRALKSPGIGMAGAVAALCPVSPGSAITIPIGIVVIRTLNRPHVRRAFVERMRQLREEPDSDTEFSMGWAFIWWLACVLIFIVLPVAAGLWWATREQQSAMDHLMAPPGSHSLEKPGGEGVRPPDTH